MDFNQLMVRMRELDQPTNEAGCDMTPPMPSAMMSPPKPDTPPPSMSINLNAQGMDNIKSMMDLWTKVNPDMMPNDPMPMPTLKVLPSLGSKGGDDPRDMLSSKEEFANSPDNAADMEYKDIDAVIPSGNDLHKAKGTYPKVSGGDNPMQRTEDQEVLSSIREYLEAELRKIKD
jgi:hypothetical protein